MNRSITLVFILVLTVSSLMIVKPVVAQLPTPNPPLPNPPKPSIPEFTLQLNGPSYTLPTTYYLNESSGQIEARLGYVVEYSYVVVNVTNQAYNSSYHLFYSVRTCEQGTNEWIYHYLPESSFTMEADSDSNYTNKEFDVTDRASPYISYLDILTGAKTDFQVQAIVGLRSPYSGAFDVSTSGDWSNNQTIDVPASIPLSPTPALTSSPTPTQSQSPSSSIPEFPSWIILPIFTAATLLSIVFIKRRITKKQR